MSNDICREGLHPNIVKRLRGLIIGVQHWSVSVIVSISGIFHFDIVGFVVVG
jgi:hypothetical protein